MLILVTGASKGVGFEVVKYFAANTEHLVVAVSRNIDSLTKLVHTRNTHSILPLRADITKAKDRLKIFNTVKELKLPLDVLINNAGQIVNKPFEKINEKELMEVYATNVFGPFALVQGLLPVFDQKRGAHVLNISSMGGFQGSSKFPGLSAYSSSKAALSGLTECLAEELKPKRISVNCLALGAVQTEMLSKAFPGYKAPLRADELAEFVCNFAVTGRKYFNGKILPVSSTTP